MGVSACSNFIVNVSYILVYSFLFDQAARPDLSATPIENISIRGPDESGDALHLLKTDV